MINKDELRAYLEQQLKDTDCFLVDVKVSRDNDIVVEIDSYENVDLDFCVELSRSIEEAFDREVEDYSLEVGSAGLTSPFKVVQQYRKNVGNEVEVLTADGRKVKGRLDEADDTGFTLGVATKVKAEGEKRPHIEEVAQRFEYNDIKYTKLIF